MWTTIRADFSESTHFLKQEQPAILNALLMIAGINFFYSALILVGFPYMLRVLLGMSSEMFGVAEGLVAAAGIAGGLITGLCSTRIRAEYLHRYLLVVGASLLPTALCFFHWRPCRGRWCGHRWLYDGFPSPGLYLFHCGHERRAEADAGSSARKNHRIHHHSQHVRPTDGPGVIRSALRCKWRLAVSTFIGRFPGDLSGRHFLPRITVPSGR